MEGLPNREATLRDAKYEAFGRKVAVGSGRGGRP